jgi:hypothetical protein
MHPDRSPEAMTDTPNHPPSRTHATPPRLKTCSACNGLRWVQIPGAIPGLSPCAHRRCPGCRYLDPITGVRASFYFAGATDTHVTRGAVPGRDDTIVVGLDPAKPGDDVRVTGTPGDAAAAVADFHRETARLQGQIAEAYGVPEALQGRRSTDRNPADVHRGIAIGLAIAACVHVAVALVVGLFRWLA